MAILPEEKAKHTPTPAQLLKVAEAELTELEGRLASVEAQCAGCDLVDLALLPALGGMAYGLKLRVDAAFDRLIDAQHAAEAADKAEAQAKADAKAAELARYAARAERQARREARQHEG